MLSNIRKGLSVCLILCLSSPVYVAAQTRPAPLQPLDSLDLPGMQSVWSELMGVASGLKEILLAKEPIADSLQRQSQNRLTLAKQDSTMAKTQIDSLSREAKVAKNIYKKAADLSVKSTKLTEYLESNNNQDSLSLRNNLPKAWNRTTQLYDEVYPPEPSEVLEAASVAVESESDKPKKGKRKKEAVPTEDSNTDQAPPQAPGGNPSTPKDPKRFAAYSPAANVLLNPPTPPCVIASNSRDEFSGEITQEMARAELFRYTNPVLITYLQGKVHVICEAALVRTGPNTSLLLTFTINDPNARKAFGRLDKNSIAILKFIDGSNFTVQNAGADDGVYNSETGATLYRAQYPLAADLLKKIRRMELDKLRIAWSNGYDDYEVQQVDLLMRQAECLFAR